MSHVILKPCDYKAFFVQHQLLGRLAQGIIDVHYPYMHQFSIKLK